MRIVLVTGAGGFVVRHGAAPPLRCLRDRAIGMLGPIRPVRQRPRRNSAKWDIARS